MEEKERREKLILENLERLSNNAKQEFQDILDNPNNGLDGVLLDTSFLYLVNGGRDFQFRLEGFIALFNENKVKIDEIHSVFSKTYNFFRKELETLSKGDDFAFYCSVSMQILKERAIEFYKDFYLSEMSELLDLAERLIRIKKTLAYFEDRYPKPTNEKEWRMDAYDFIEEALSQIQKQIEKEIEDEAELLKNREKLSIQPSSLINDTYTNLLGITLEEIAKNFTTEIETHKSNLMKNITNPREIDAYLNKYFSDLSLPFAVKDVHSIIHKDKGENKELVEAHSLYCREWSDYLKNFFTWELIEKFLNYLPSVSEKLTRLVAFRNEIKMKEFHYVANNPNIKRTIEIKCSEKIKELEHALTLDSQIEEEKSAELNSKSSMVTQEKVLALLLLLEATGAKPTKGNNKDFAKFITELTGDNFDNVYKLVLNLGVSEKVSNSTYNARLRRINDIFIKLGGIAYKTVDKALGIKRNEY